MVTLGDGRTETIANIVNQKMDVEVLYITRRLNNLSHAFHCELGSITGKLIYSAFYLENGQRLTCTANHLLLTEDGYLPAGEMEIGERLVAAVPVAELASQVEMIATRLEIISAYRH
ncbi:MAG: Hint domain-containing protein [Anaerolineae bacterium]